MTTDKTPATLDAVRNLIVCDTQFTWAGVTNLTMPQMMDLQARGWVVEGDDNGEFQLTEAGEAVVARALEHGAPATLATVKHGGCVQLAASERARFDAFLRGNPFMAFMAGTAWQVWQAALSAQPSPGGQDALADAARRVISDIDSGDYHGEISEATYAALEAALAARQPVGQITDAEIDARLNALYREMVDSGQHNCGMSGVAWDRAVFRMASKQPAQAVDLGQQQDAARWRAIAPHLSVEWDEDEMLKRWTWIDFKGDALSVPTRTRESYASVDEAMDAVIDSQAVQS